MRIITLLIFLMVKGLLKCIIAFEGLVCIMAHRLKVTVLRFIHTGYFGWGCG